MKKFVSIITAVCTMAAIISCSALPVSAATIKGDLNGDNKISLRDASMIQRMVANLMEPTDDQKASADFNGDGKISGLDAFTIQKYVALDAATVNSMVPYKSKVIQFVEIVNEDRIAKGLEPFEINDATLFAGVTRVQEVSNGYANARPNSKGLWTIFTEYNLSYNSPYQYQGTGSSDPSSFYNNMKKSSTEAYDKLMMSKHNTLIVGTMPSGIMSYQWVVVVG